MIESLPTDQIDRPLMSAPGVSLEHTREARRKNKSGPINGCSARGCYAAVQNSWMAAERLDEVVTKRSSLD
jgi:hypothetical protein